jgi:hypothetical protein
VATLARRTETARTNEKATILFASGWMERMKNSHDLEATFWQMLEKNRLVDLSQYHKPDFFEEVPLFSRYADIAFLKHLSVEEASEVLLRYSLKFLRAVIAYEDHETPFFAAITVSDVSPGDPIVPSLFVWSRPLVELYERLRLKKPTTPFAKRIKRLVSELAALDFVQIFEEASPAPEAARAWLAPLLPPYHSFAPIYMFAQSKPVEHARAVPAPAAQRKRSVKI